MSSPEQMQITLKLYCDQSQLIADPSSSLVWELFVNGRPFPHKHANILTSLQVDEIIKPLVDLEEKMSEPPEDE